jgi:hypothetical protein
MKKILFITFLTLLLITYTGKSSAQTADLGIYPPVFEIEANPPASLKLPFFIQNYSEEAVELNISLIPFKASSSERGEIEYVDTANAFPDPFLLQRIRILEEDSEIKKTIVSGKQRKDLVLEIKIPSNEEKGEYYFSVIASSKPVTGPDSNSSKASLGIATNVLLSVGPLGKTEGLIQEFSSPKFIFSGPVPFNLRVKNTSDHYISPKGDIQIKNMFGQTVGRIDLLPVNILSGSTRRIPDSLQTGTASEKDYARIKKTVEQNKFPVSVWPEKFLLGLYKATLTIALSDKGPLFKRSIYFFAFPAEYLLGLLIITGFVIYISVRVRKRLTIK